MAHSPYVFDATAENFHTLVLENSDKGPVLVNYWSPRAGPCLMLMPRLIRLATEFGGRFLLVMLNTDDLGLLAREHGVNSLPTIKVFRRGKVVDTLRGAESETVLREFISKHMLRETSDKIAASVQGYQREDLDQAVRQVAEAALSEPENPHLAIDLVKLLMLQQRFAQAESLLKNFPEKVRDHPEIQDLSAHVSFIRTAQESPPVPALEQTLSDSPDDLEARYQLCAVKITQNDYAAAMQQLLEIARRDFDFRGQAASRGMHAIFSLLGVDNELVRHYRTLLDEVMQK
ncbi:MAG: tetratricopeptide repeat protein [Gammaproteobacteria bacterium]|nr:tetratricopeptide repeat protein [Gammaproteobacteria bacterium]MDH3369803.1 tetratricopeptide repeat protein [Gammaproteobacteria bacterium]MDH3407048.1 tetratricopeptide repeat protein [Gammaproteobacteria bacterium]MDH3563826.1 tetratricopeptide repeat protein [Gammaproteobacteria bacterium]MDH5487156.1 tetratricopeptide repeat protein [Gammaproteobacteria bacterium]